ncbi:MAG: hypothetical protein WD396_09440 [Pseudohongiellaceae bacterium]
MRDNDDLNDIPPLVPDSDDVNTHRSNKRAQGREIVRPAHHGARTAHGARTVRAGVSWPVRIMLVLLTLATLAGGYGAYYFYDIYQTDLRRANLRISDLETRLNIVDQSATETGDSLMEDINQTIEQYDLLWANWRNNNRQFDEIQSEIARLKMVNEGQDETTTNNSRQLAQNAEAIGQVNASLNALGNEFDSLGQTVASLDTEMSEFASMRGDLESIRQSLNSGDSTIGGLAGRVEYMEQSMESINAHRLQINESLFRLQENVESLQRAVSTP